MADNWTQNVVCRYFENGMCHKGNNCRYRHVQENITDDGNNVIPLTTPPVPWFNTTCQYFNRGYCKFSSQCHYRHNADTRENNAGSTITTDGLPSGVRVLNSSPATDQKNKKEELPERCLKAPEFVPSSASPVAGSSSLTPENKACATSGGSTTDSSTPVSYARALNPNGEAFSRFWEPVCPYAAFNGVCKKKVCKDLHGNICELCGRAALHPYNEELQKMHTNACVRQHEINMELAFAIQRSKDKSCGVCFETIMEKPSYKRRFGILPNCNHCFCLTCIRKWRQAKQFDNKIVKACPECRVASDFVCPSMYWVDTKEEKEKIIMAYKSALSTMDCRYFNKGRGKCPFGNKCFYRHALSDGTKQNVGPPGRQSQRRNGDRDYDILYRSNYLNIPEYVEDSITGLSVRDMLNLFFQSEDISLSDID